MSARARRGLLYMPADDERKIRKAATLEVDCVCMDLEDGVAASRKVEARAGAVRALSELDFGGSEKIVRINAIGSGLEVADLAAVLGGPRGARPDALIVPKVEAADELRWVSARIAEAEARQGWTPGGIGLFGLVETARGVVELRSIADADPRLEALLFGAEDLAGDVGMTRTREGSEIRWARGAVVMHAAAFGLDAFDMIHPDFRDEEGLRALAREGAGLGFSGMQLIHPSQVGPGQAAFTPDAEAIERARSVVDLFEKKQLEGSGVFAVGGKMLELPMVRAARRILERARAAGLP